MTETVWEGAPWTQGNAGGAWGKARHLVLQRELCEGQWGGGLVRPGGGEGALGTRTRGMWPRVRERQDRQEGKWQRGLGRAQQTKPSHTEEGPAGSGQWTAWHPEAPRPGVQASCRHLKGGLQACLIPGPASLGPAVCPLLSLCPLLTLHADLVQPASSTSKEPACCFHPAPALPARPGHAWRTAAVAQHRLSARDPGPPRASPPHTQRRPALSCRTPLGASGDTEDRGP